MMASAVGLNCLASPCPHEKKDLLGWLVPEHRRREIEEIVNEPEPGDFDRAVKIADLKEMKRDAASIAAFQGAAAVVLAGVAAAGVLLHFPLLLAVGAVAAGISVFGAATFAKYASFVGEKIREIQERPEQPASGPQPSPSHP